MEESETLHNTHDLHRTLDLRKRPDPATGGHVFAPVRAALRMLPPVDRFDESRSTQPTRSACLVWGAHLASGVREHEVRWPQEIHLHGRSTSNVKDAVMIAAVAANTLAMNQ
jgi:hypothetical protein